MLRQPVQRHTSAATEQARTRSDELRQLEAVHRREPDHVRQEGAFFQGALHRSLQHRFVILLFFLIIKKLKVCSRCVLKIFFYSLDLVVNFNLNVFFLLIF